MDISLPGFSVHGISQARKLAWVATPSSRGPSQPRGRTCVSCVGRLTLYHWATREAQRDHVEVFQSTVPLKPAFKWPQLEYQTHEQRKHFKSESCSQGSNGAEKSQPCCAPPQFFIHRIISTRIIKWLWFYTAKVGMIFFNVTEIIRSNLVAGSMVLW